MGLFKKKKDTGFGAVSVQTATSNHPFYSFDDYTPLGSAQTKLYAQMKEAIPVIDAAIEKIVRLTLGFKVKCQTSSAQTALDDFFKYVKVGGSGFGLETFISNYLNDLLTYGNAVGEIALNKSKTSVCGLYNANIENIEVKQGTSPLDIILYKKSDGINPVKITNPQLVYFSALSPKSGGVLGQSLLCSLPFVSDILIRIFNSIGQNFDRIGNLRFAVTYKPSADSLDRTYAKERAMQIAKEWSDGMVASKNGQIKDFISVGDVDIKVIGADNQMIDCQVPARQMLEQIVAKLSIPPFILGLSWSTSERMSKQQADILTSELEYYRRLLEPIILRVCTTFLRINGFSDNPQVEWDIINMQDEVDNAKVQLYLAQAEKLQRGDNN